MARLKKKIFMIKFIQFLVKRLRAYMAKCHGSIFIKTLIYYSSLQIVPGANFFPLEKALFVCWLLNVPATCQCFSGTDLLRQLYVLPHWDRNCRPNFPSHPVIVFWHNWPHSGSRLARAATGVSVFKSLVSGIRTRDLPLSRRIP